MAIGARNRWLNILLVAVFALSPASVRAQSAGPAVPPNLAAAVAQYRRALEAYNSARQVYAAVAAAYWRSISEKRRLRNSKRAHGEALALDDYVLDQPPVYTGPSKPRDPLQPEAPERPPYVPVVADFLAAAQQEFKFSPRLPQNDGEFKRAYAVAASSAGLTKDQAVRIYSFRGHRKRQLRCRGRARI